MKLIQPHLMVLDDDRFFCDFVRAVAESIEYKVDTFTDPELFEAAYNDGVDVVVLDLQMPGADGIEVIRFLAGKHCPSDVIIMSGYDKMVLHSAKELARARGLDVIGSLSKPIEYRELLSLLQSRILGKTLAGNNQGVWQPLEEDIRNGIQNAQFIPYFQPQVNLQTGELVGFESLIRWEHPEEGLIGPGLFIPLAEKNGMIGELTHLMLDQAMTYSKIFSDVSLPHQVSVNLSPDAVYLELPETIVDLMDKHQVEARSVMLEITETAIVIEKANFLDIVTRLRLLGIGLSIDDYGTGYSSLSQLYSSPFTELKIDLSFVKNAEDVDEARAIVKSTIALGQELGLTVVAEGVENQNTWNLLKDMGCNLAQGYYISKAMHPSEVIEWASNWNTPAMPGVINSEA